MAEHELDALKALDPHVTRDSDRRAYRDRLVKAHIDAALYQTKTGRARIGWRTYRNALRVPGSSLRKLKGALRLAVAAVRGKKK
jgi:hypothetical protein